MSRWFRFYDETLNDPKILKLSDKLHRVWIGILCVASKNNGLLPPLEDMALMIRMTPAKLDEAIKSLMIAGLIDDDGVSLTPHNWNARQFKSDVSNERVQRYRERKRNVTVAPPETETETEKKEDTAAAVPRTYVFEDGVIRLNARDFETWRKAFSNLDLAAELLSLSKWAESEGGKWFHAVKGALAKRNREVKATRENLAATGGFKWNGDIEGVI